MLMKKIYIHSCILHCFAFIEKEKEKKSLPQITEFSYSYAHGDCSRLIILKVMYVTIFNCQEKKMIKMCDA